MSKNILRLTHLLALLVAGCCCKLPGKKGGTSTAPSATAVPAPPAPRGPDPLASKGAPSWASWGGVARLLDAGGTYKKLAARSGAPSIDEQTLVCDVEVDGNWDAVPFFGAPDLRLDITAGSYSEASLNGPEDTNHAYFSLARVKLNPGETLKIHLHDRDATGRGKAIGDGEVAFDGTLPMRMSGPRFRVACQALSPEDQRSMLTLRLGAIDRDASAVRAKMKADPSMQDWGFSRGPLPGAQAAVEDAAALAGWEHPEVRKRADAHTRLLEAWDQEIRVTINDLLKKLPAQQAPQTIPVFNKGQLRARLLGARCVLDTCEAELEIEPLPGSSLTRETLSRDLSPDFVLQNGKKNSARIEDELTPASDETLVAGKRYVLRLKEPLMDTQGGANPARILRLLPTMTSAHFFRLPDP